MNENVDATVNEDDVIASLDDQTPEAGVEENATEEVVAEIEPTVHVPVPTEVENVDLSNGEASQEAAVAEPAALIDDADDTGESGFDLSAPEQDDEAGDGDEGGDSERVVRMLAVGQQVDGVVRRVTEFGAFVDIGVGRDGLIHISELSSRRVAKVSDVLSEKQPIQPWIKKLDRKRNRISLTLIDPEMKTIRDLESGEIVQGTVTRILPYGAFVDIGIGRDALLHVREMSTGFVEKPEDIVQVGETIEGRIIEVSRRRGRVDLSLKGLREEPEPEVAPAVVEEVDEVLDEVDQFEDVEVLSPMELAFKKAVEAEGAEIQISTKKRGKRDRRRDSRSIQDEIIARTLDTGRK